MKVMITGASGFVGSWIARELVAAGHQVRALVRSTAKLDNLAGLGDQALERVEGDVLDRGSVERALAGCDAVMHTAGVAHFLPGERQRMYDVNHRGVENVLGAALDRGVRRAVLTSSTAAGGGSRTPRVADESMPSSAEASGIDYFISKYRGEQAALALAQRGLEVCALRPVVLLGPGDIYHSSTTTFLAVARRKLPVIVAGGASFTDVRDVARAHVTALERGRAGEIYYLGGHNLKTEEVTSLTARLVGVEPPRTVPFPLAYGVAAGVELSSRLLGRHADLSRQLVAAARLYTWVSSDKAERELDYRIRPLEESLRDTFRFFLENGRLEPHTPELRALALARAA
jgi:dihydroflavonol-4-reductase